MTTAALVGLLWANQGVSAQSQGKEYLYADIGAGNALLKIDVDTGLSVHRIQPFPLPTALGSDTYATWRGRLVGLGSNFDAFPFDFLYARNPGDASYEVLMRIENSWATFNSCMDVNPITGRMYASVTYVLYELDPATQEQTLIGPITGTGQFNVPFAMAFDASGKCIIPGGWITSNVIPFFTLDLTTAVATKIGDVGPFPSGSIYDLAYDEHGTLWASYGAAPIIKERGGLYKIDLATLQAERAFDGSWSHSQSGHIHGITFLRDSPVHPYCAPKTNSLGCAPELHYHGIANPGARRGFKIWLTNVRNQQSGTLIYSLAGPANMPFSGGSLCVTPPYQITSVVASGGSASPTQNCSGRWDADFNTIMNEQGLLPVGTHVQAQFLGRDSGFAWPDNIALSSAIDFELLP